MGESGSDNLLDRPVESLSGIALRRKAQLNRMGIYSLYDLITYFPRDYEDWSNISSVEELVDKEEASFIAYVRQKPTLQRKGKLSILRVTLADESGVIKGIWFNQPYLLQKLTPGERYFFRGKIRRDGRNFDVNNPMVQALGETEGEEAHPQIRAFYPLTKGINQGHIRSFIQETLPKVLEYIPEPLPGDIRKKEQLCSAAFAYEKIHYPDSLEALEIARKRLIYEELFLVQGALRWIKQKNKFGRKAYALKLDQQGKDKLEKVVQNLPFSLTADQQQVRKDIFRDLKKELPMNRLIQGDVGSGKTVVAALALIFCALAGGQSIFMAPTSILAQQHYQNLLPLLKDTGIEMALLLGSTPAAARKKLRLALKDGSISILIGTHAVLQEQANFKQLALAVTDEQHRFGVRQRALFLQQESYIPHTLVMSATPIPRTLALILYGDLDISVIAHRPSGRQPIETYLADSEADNRLIEIVKRQVQSGRQVYYVCPLIEDSVKEEDAENPLRAATELFTHLAQEVFVDFKIGLLHGGLKAQEKERVMSEFLAGEIQILVATTVVEVGVDNPNASLMVIENAERFGLAQLHQLRGRIGRGPHRSICVIKSDHKDEVVQERLKAFCRTADGFEIAQQDLKLRGPGDFFGTRQHGIPALRIANLYRDTLVLKRVGEALDDLFAQDPEMVSETFETLIQAFNRRFGSEWQHPAL